MSGVQAYDLRVIAAKVAEARAYADREGFEVSTICPTREETTAILDALEAAATRLDAEGDSDG